MAMSDELRATLSDPRTAGMLRERAERILRREISLFTESDLLNAWTPVVGRELGRELIDALAFAERLDQEETALIGELALVAEDVYRAWSAELDTDGAEWRNVQWSFTERRGHKSIVLHVNRWDGEVIQIRSSGHGLGRLLRRLAEAQVDFAEKGAMLDEDELGLAIGLLARALGSDDDIDDDDPAEDADDA